MKELLTKLKKAVDRALDLHAPTKEIELAEFPGYVVKSLETILADKDTDRAASRLAVLRAKVDEVSEIAKQTAGAAEDTESQRVNVTVFEEPGLSAAPKVESERGPEAAGSGTGASAVAAPNGALGKALEQLRQEVAEIKGLLGKQKDDDEDDKDMADGKKEEGSQAKAKDEEDEDKDKAAAGEKDRDKAKDEDDEEKKAGVAKAVNWPLDMNATMPGAEPIEKRNPDLDWGCDPERIAEAG